MTPKEKAKEILNKFYMLVADTIVESDKTHANTLNTSELAMFLHEKTIRATAQAKKCATLSIDYIIQENIDNVVSTNNSECDGMNNNSFWQEVKKEIERL